MLTTDMLGVARCWLVLLLTGAALTANAAELGGVDAARAGFDPARTARITGLLQEYVDAGRIPGAALLVVRDGRVVLDAAVGFRDLEARRPMTTDTLFRIASMTKAVVSVGVLMLQEEGRLLLSDPVGRYLPEFLETSVAVPANGDTYTVVAADRPITLRDLLTHTAGIGYGGGPAREAWAAAGIQGWYFANRTEPIQDTVRRMAGLPMDAQPGAAFVYGYSTDILGAVIEVVSGQSLADFLEERIFTPLDMRDTSFYVAESERVRLAVVYSADEAGSLSRAPDESAMVGQGEYASGPRRSYSGGAGLVSTTRDYGRFLQALAAGGTLDGTRILSPGTVRLMTVDHLHGVAFQPGQGFGLGFATTLDVGARGLPGSTGEFGWGGAYHTVYWVDPVERLVVVYMTQILPAGGLDDAGKVRSLIYSALVK